MRSASLLLIIAALALLSCSQDNVDTDYLLSPERGSWIDLTYDFTHETIVWPTSERFSIDTVFAGHTDAGFYYESFRFCTAEHGGTHMDAPIHFSEDRLRAHEVPLYNLIAHAAVVDVSVNAQRNRDYQITVEDVTSWERHNGRSINGLILLFRTGFGDFWPDAEKYMGTNKRGEAGVAELCFPGIHPDTAKWLVENRDIRAVGLDTPSLDYGKSTLFESHQFLAGDNIPGFENVANLDRLPPYGAFVVALPMKIRDGSGAPLRIVAFVPD